MNNRPIFQSINNVDLMFVLLLSDEIDATSMAGVKKYDPIIDYCSLPAESNINQMKSLKEIIFGEKKK